ncbi:S ribonuclease [Pyrus ussuriensis x Pyrus communis]|uniref:S ribonuclease n=1 Tax=Pyrus ussuriensis x Pyrus communis TaxID=2448454 RepID=A0A5N5F8E0_9ROSA|nr:S ribonuclease [Pyrus ussuriensis x Pyrus communis]
MAGNTTFAHAQPFHRSTRSQATRNFSRAVTDDQVPTFSSTQAKNFFSVVAARKVVLERRIIWDDLSLADAIHSNDLVKWIWFDFIRGNVLGTSYNGNPTLESARVLFAMLIHCDMSFGFLIFKSIIGSTIHPCLITQLCKRAGVQKRPDDLCPRTIKDLDRNIINLSNVMYDVAQVNPRPSKINSLRKKIVDFKSLIRQSASSPLVSHSVSTPSLSQTSMNLPSFVLEPSLRPPKLGKHIQFTCSSVKDKDAEGFGNGTHTGDALVEDAIAAGSLIGSDDSLQLKEF